MSSTGILQPRPSKGILQPRFSKLSRFKNLSVKMISHSRGYSNPDLLGDTPTPLLKNCQDLKIFLCQKKLFSIHGDTPTPSFNYKLIIVFFSSRTFTNMSNKPCLIKKPRCISKIVDSIIPR